MARPQKEGMDYFPHDTDAVNDEKVEALRSIYGNDGYAFYFIMLERIYRTKSFEIDVSDAETREETFQILSRKIAVSREVFNQILQTSLKWGCFSRQWYEEKGIISSEGIKKRASVVLEKRAAMRDKYNRDKDKVSDAETMEETEEETPQSKEKKSKDIYIADSEYLWGLYPEKKGRTDAMKKLPKLVKQYGKDQIERAIQRYIKEVDRQRKNGFPDLRYKYGSTFFNKWVLDYLDDKEPPKQKPVVIEEVFIQR